MISGDLVQVYVTKFIVISSTQCKILGVSQNPTQTLLRMRRLVCVCLYSVWVWSIANSS